MHKRRNTNCKVVKARKTYRCSCCEKDINIGDSYLRINIKGKGIFHFCNLCKKDENFIEFKINNPLMDSSDYEDCMERAWIGCSEQAGY